MIFLLVPAAFIRVRRLFEGGVYSNKYGMIIFPCSEMFQNVPGCSRIFHAPDFIDGLFFWPGENKFHHRRGCVYKMICFSDRSRS